MGLGKTVEVLALVLAHPWRGRGECNTETKGCDTVGTAVELGVRGASGAHGEDVGEEEGVETRADCTDAAMNDLLPCVCGGTPSIFDGVYIGCDTCGRWVHSCCAGIASEAEAEGVASYTCLQCALKRTKPSVKQLGRARTPASLQVLHAVLFRCEAFTYL